MYEIRGSDIISMWNAIRVEHVRVTLYSPKKKNIISSIRLRNMKGSHISNKFTQATFISPNTSNWNSCISCSTLPVLAVIYKQGPDFDDLKIL